MVDQILSRIIFQVNLHNRSTLNNSNISQLLIAGRKWFARFLVRHDDITLRTPEQVTAASAKVSEGDLRGWFTSVENFFISAQLMRAINDPQRVFNGDETSFFLHPITKAVLATPGNKNVYEIQHADGHTNVTVMFTFGADGSMVPPDVVLPVQRIRPEILQQFPGDWGVGKSPNGWMNVENFMLYIRQIFYPFLLKKNVEFPVIYFVDGHSSHTAIEVADLCMDLGIILVALYPNTTRITQPADVAIFKPLKSAWQTAVTEWRNQNAGDILSLKHFPSALKKAINTGIKKASIITGFRVCGLFPFGPDNVDFSKCLASSNEVPSDAVDLNQNATEDQSTPDDVSIVLQDYVLTPTDTIKKALDDIGAERLHRIMTQANLTEEEVVIRSLYDKLLAPHLTFQNAADNNEQNNPTVPDDDEHPVQESADCHGPPSEVNSDCNSEDHLNDMRSTDTVSALADRTNYQSDGKRNADDISSFLQTPPTPKRSKKHRNYTRKFFPILTAEERLNEIRRLEQEKENSIMEKNEKAEQRKKDKEQAEVMKLKKAEEREEIKKQKAVLRQQKRKEILQRKKERELNSKMKQLKADGMKKDKLELLQALKLSKC